MKRYFIIIILSLIFLSCKKDKEKNTNCFSDTPTTRTILNKQATIQLFNNEFYVIEMGAIDTKLLPCSLSVTITGEVKNTVPRGACCIENFVINGITK